MDKEEDDSSEYYRETIGKVIDILERITTKLGTVDAAVVELTKQLLKKGAIGDDAAEEILQVLRSGDDKSK
jgi:hypothetical protein